MRPRSGAVSCISNPCFRVIWSSARQAPISKETEVHGHEDGNEMPSLDLLSNRLRLPGSFGLPKLIRADSPEALPLDVVTERVELLPGKLGSIPYGGILSGT